MVLPGMNRQEPFLQPMELDTRCLFCPGKNKDGVRQGKFVKVH